MTELASGGYLTPATVVGYLERRGVLPPRSGATACALRGGVSNEVLRVDGPGVSVVVKQALARLRVADEWTANRERTLTEAAALRLTAELTPGHVPQVVDIDPDDITITIAAAPTGWTDWKAALLSPESTPSDVEVVAVAGTLASIVGRWQLSTGGCRLVGTRFDDPRPFEQLRVCPYHRTVVQRCPDLAKPVEHVIDTMGVRRDCLVHGDFSPKNVLVGDGAVWVIDFEAAHLGDPRFDLAFMLCHWAMKSVHQPWRARVYRSAARKFLTNYRATVADGQSGGWADVVDRDLSMHVGALLAARVAGKSPANYLTASERETVMRIGRHLLTDPPDEPLDAWKDTINEFAD